MFLIKLQKIYGDDVESKILTRISSEISKRGITDVLRNKVKDHGQYIDLCYFKPNSDLNPSHFNLYKKNKFSVIRQLHFSTENHIKNQLFKNWKCIFLLMPKPSYELIECS